MKLFEARARLKKCIEIMDKGNSLMSYVAIVTEPGNVENYWVEFGTENKKMGNYTDKIRLELNGTKGNKTKNNYGNLLSSHQKLKECVRPIRAGTSICENVSICKSGTLGILFKLEGYDSPFGISNMHVLSSYLSTGENRNILITNEHQEIIQPSSSDRTDLFYTIDKEVPIGQTVWETFNGLVDAAVFQIYENESCSVGIFNSEINDLNNNQIKEPKLNRGCQKAGRTTGFTQAKILSVEAAIRIENPFHKINGLGKYVVFTDQIMTENMAASGDSGSVLFSEKHVVGLTFADIDFDSNISISGSGTTHTCGRTFHNKMTNVFSSVVLPNGKGDFLKPKFKNFLI